MATSYGDLILLMDLFDDHFAMLSAPWWFKSWLKGNMHIYHDFERRAWEQHVVYGRSKYSARMIIQDMRWHSTAADSTPDHKIVNDCTPYMARLVMLANPQLGKFFRTKS